MYFVKLCRSAQIRSKHCCLQHWHKGWKGNHLRIEVNYTFSVFCMDSYLTKSKSKDSAVAAFLRSSDCHVYTIHFNWFTLRQPFTRANRSSQSPILIVEMVYWRFEKSVCLFETWCVGFLRLNKYASTSGLKFHCNRRLKTNAKRKFNQWLFGFFSKQRWQVFKCNK